MWKRLRYAAVVAGVLAVLAGAYVSAGGVDLSLAEDTSIGDGGVLGVHRGEVVPDDAGGCLPSERPVGSVVIVEVDEPVVGVGALGF